MYEFWINAVHKFIHMNSILEKRLNHLIQNVSYSDETRTTWIEMYNDTKHTTSLKVVNRDGEQDEKGKYIEYTIIDNVPLKYDSQYNLILDTPVLQEKIDRVKTELLERIDNK